MEAFEKEQVPKDMRVKAPQTLLQVVYAAYENHLKQSDCIVNHS